MSDSGGWTPDLKENYHKHIQRPPGRHMRYPYTLTSQLVQFPYRFQVNTSYTARWFLYGSLGAMAVFYYLDKLIRTPENYEFTWKKRAEDMHYHYKRP